MIRFFAAFLTCLFFLSSAGRAETPIPADAEGQVSLTWEKFSEIWEKLQRLEKRLEELSDPTKTPPPPVPFSLTRAAYQGRVGEKRTSIDAVFEIDVFDKKNWVKVPFLPATVAIQEARLDNAPVGVVQENGYHHAVFFKSGRHALRVRFSVKSPSAEEAPRLALPVSNTPMTLLALEFPRSGLDVIVEPSQGTEVQTADGKTRVTAVIPTTSQIEARWQKALAPEKTLPAKMYVDSQALLTVSESAVRAQTVLNYNILHQGVRELEIAVPRDWNLLSVMSEGLQEWKIREKDGAPVLALLLDYAKKGSFQVSVQMEKAISEKDEVLEIPRLKPADVERETGVLAVEAKGAVELEIPDASGLQPMDPQELPPSLWEMATQPLLYAYRYTKPYTLAVAVKRHPEAPVLTTTVDYANALTLFTERGQMVTRLQYQVRNHLKQYLSVQLPEGAELWSAFVADEPVKPTKTQDNVYRIPLARSLETQGQAGFPVELIYYRQASRFLPVGYKETVFPVPDAPVSRLLWSVYVPDRYRIARFGGDMEKGGLASGVSPLFGRAVGGAVTGTAAGRTSRLAKKISADLLDLDEKFYPELEHGKPSPKETEAEWINRQEKMQSEGFALPQSAAQAVRPGVFPISFDIPSTGQLFNFGQVMIVGQSPRLNMLYLHAWIVRSLFLALLGYMGVLLYRNRESVARVGRVLSVVFQNLVHRIAQARRHQKAEA
jgi:hypothetical protein